jgi:Fic family protein
LAGVSGLVPSVDWLLYSAIRKEALLTSQIEGTQATLSDLFDEDAGFKVSNTDDVEEVANYVRAFRWTQDQLRDAKGLPISVRLLCEAHRPTADRSPVRAMGATARTLDVYQWLPQATPG